MDTSPSRSIPPLESESESESLMDSSWWETGFGWMIVMAMMAVVGLSG